ncbi:hypothetical protein BABINDRAFT_95500 [Babjeviella inositovora NRRL Y-12698]|uniref:Uncharacterized protein n=1 Tax=Babjeviella inositovora NRRL Y-12698 TaxID=984486 RepID=A0A1E3QJW7_9ASCO|nr:uncharacterized protein BABINDRAFT_95500 [Babjeviella inositovora NRRL Y-12698]ODQ77918.1 hypothetical protein BABINDRAFT_95500 [Babjeviella inositovora NRRL Y-12698]
MASATKVTLDSHDKLVLCTLFDKEMGGVASKYSEADIPRDLFFDEDKKIIFNYKTGVMIDMNLPPERYVEDANIVEAYLRIEVEAISIVDLISPTERDALVKLQSSKSILETRILNDPSGKGQKYASVYNNVAQIERYLLLLFESTTLVGDTIPELEESYTAATLLNVISLREKHITSLLYKAIELALPEQEVQSNTGLNQVTYKLSARGARILSAAYGQLAAVYLDRAARFERLAAGYRAQNLAPETLKPILDIIFSAEVSASNLMNQAAFFGDEFTGLLALKVNPYAKLCGSIVKDSIVDSVNKHINQ